MKEHKHYTPEQIEQANSADISDYVHSRGFACEKAGKEIHIKGYGGLYINPETNEFYCHSANKGGRGLLDFCKKILDMPFLEAMREIVGDPETIRQLTSKSAEELQKGDRISYAGKTWTVTAVSDYSISLESGKDKDFISNTPSTRFLNEKKWTEKLTEAGFKFIGKAAEIKQFTPKVTAEPQEKKEFKMPEKSPDQKKLYAYLIKQRMLSSQTINDLVKQGVLYQGYVEFPKEDGSVSKHENIIFLHRNDVGEPCGADIQGVYTASKFKGIVPPNETDRGFVYSKGDPNKTDTVYLFEAPIDLMSFVELHPEIENAKFVAMGGLKPTIAEHYINSNMNVVSCVDNDVAGQKFNNKILSEKMQEALSANEDDITPKVINDREPPLHFLEAAINGKECSIFLSRSDYKEAAAFNADIKNNVLVWVNKSNFTVNRECAEAGVKDFNDLLKNIKSAEKEVSPLENTEKFVEETNKIADWAEKAKNTAMERLNDTRQENTR